MRKCINKIGYWIGFCLLFASFTLGNAFARVQQNGGAMRLEMIEVVGLKRNKQEDIIKASGLQVGQTVDSAAIDSAAQRLIDSGLFTNLSYRLRSTGAKATVTFQVEEAKGNLPIVFDNFVWFTNEELLSHVRQDVPGFDGTTPEAGNTAEQIAKSLRRLLTGRGIKGQVNYQPTSDLAGNVSDYNFSVTGAPLSLCDLRFPGATGIAEAELMKNSKPLFEETYSQAFTTGFVNANLIPLYRQRGFLRAAFQAPSAVLKKGSDAECRDGIAISVPIEEGIAYIWTGAEWAGASALTPQELNAALGMRANEIANGVKFDEGLVAVRKAYGKKGFIMAKLTATPSFDNAAKAVGYRIAVGEGAQYRMGELVIKGLPEADAERLRKNWKLAPGTVFDASYMEEFLRRQMLSMMRRDIKLETTYKPNRERLTVDVTIEFK